MDLFWLFRIDTESESANVLAGRRWKDPRPIKGQSHFVFNRLAGLLLLRLFLVHPRHAREMTMTSRRYAFSSSVTPYLDDGNHKSDKSSSQT